MNDLSWMIYAADVAGAANVAATVAACITFGAALVFAGPVADIEGDGRNRDAWRKLARQCAYWTILPVAIAVLAPSTTTIYAIAASEMGEEIIETETAGKAMQALDAWLDRQIEGASQ